VAASFGRIQRQKNLAFLAKYSCQSNFESWQAKTTKTKQVINKQTLAVFFCKKKKKTQKIQKQK
jgi:hypothetical protein